MGALTLARNVRPCQLSERTKSRPRHRQIFRKKNTRAACFFFFLEKFYLTVPYFGRAFFRPFFRKADKRTRRRVRRTASPFSGLCLALNTRSVFCGSAGFLPCWGLSVSRLQTLAVPLLGRRRFRDISPKFARAANLWKISRLFPCGVIFALLGGDDVMQWKSRTALPP